VRALPVEERAQMAQVLAGGNDLAAVNGLEKVAVAGA
jgi:hypothetical protein